MVDGLSPPNRAVAPAGSHELSLEEIELYLLLDGIAMHYGYDFREYAMGPLRRNILMSMALEGVPTISAYQDRLLHDAECMQRFLNTVGVNVTSIFREAAALRILRDDIAPWLRTFPSVRMWVAGCATGEEVASLAIVLREARLLSRTVIYATDINERSLAVAAGGIYPLENMTAGDAHYRRSGGVASLSDYYTVKGNMARFDPSLFNRVTWARHNLITDASFNAFHVILCTNVLTHFGPLLQARVHRLLFESLVRSGYLIIGKLESVIHWSDFNLYSRVHDGAGVYRKEAA